MPVDALMKPGADRSDVARGEVGLDLDPRGAECRHELGGKDRPYRVAREIAERPLIPVDVLQATLAVMAGADAEQAAHPLRPGGGQVGNAERAGEERFLELVAEDDMGGVGHLVGIDPDQGAADAPPMRPHRFRIEAGGLIREGAGELGGEMGDEGVVASELHLDEERLALMHRHARRLPNRLVEEILRQVLLIERVPAFMQHAEQGAGEIGLVVTGGDPHVIRRAAAERMKRGIEAGAAKIEPDPDGRLAAERFLGRPRIGAGRKRWWGGAGLDRGERPGQEAAIGGKEGFEIGLHETGLEAVHQRVVRRETECCGERCGAFTHQAEERGERGGDEGEVALAPRHPPAFLAGRSLARLGLDQIARHRPGAAQAVVHQREIGLLPRIIAGLRPIERRFGDGRGEEIVSQPGEGGEFLGPFLSASFRHHRRLVPLQDGGGLFEPGDAREDAAGLAIGSVHARSAPLSQIR